ncbi:ATP-binding cassette domain-containing protein [Bosea sp. TAB14]|jgi:putative ABC transport system ATP-binding protein|uniref:ATP-binding cassette domain-containing protein n=1 Tax=Bosea sp. TAB14 TaxID=3237481 RepID=UPI003F93AE0E
MPASPSPEPATGRLTLENLALDHRDADGQPFRLIDIPLLAIEPGSRFGVSGPSGCGKSSLLHLVAGLLRPSRGRILWHDRAVSELSESGRDRWRRETIGFVFQDFHLIPELDIAANIALPASFSAWRLSGTEKDAPPLSPTAWACPIRAAAPPCFRVASSSASPSRAPFSAGRL